MNFSQTPAISVTLTSLPSDSCALYIYANTGGSAYQWVQVPGTLTPFFGYSFTIQPAAPYGGSQIQLQPNQTQLTMVAC